MHPNDQRLTVSTEIHSYITNKAMLKSDNYQKAIKVKDPQSFGGKASACVSFFSQLSIVFASDPIKFNLEKNKILYTISHLQGNVYAYMEPYLSHLDRPLDEQPEEIKNFAALKRTLTVLRHLVIRILR
jgi:hypothetical protein